MKNTFWYENKKPKEKITVTIRCINYRQKGTILIF